MLLFIAPNSEMQSMRRLSVRSVLARMDSYKTLLSLLVLCDEYQVEMESMGHWIAERLRAMALDKERMSLNEVAFLLLVDIAGMTAVREIGKQALRLRLNRLEFDEHGEVSLSFRSLPAEAVSFVLTSWSTPSEFRRERRERRCP